MASGLRRSASQLEYMRPRRACVRPSGASVSSHWRSDCLSWTAAVIATSDR